MPAGRSRRTFLALAGSSLTLSVGCTGGRTGDTTPTATSHADTPTRVPTESPGPPTSPQWASVGLEATGTACGGTPTVEFRETGDRVHVVGTLVVSSLCHRAGLRTAAVADGVARLVVVQRAVTTDGTSACGQCVADAGFEIRGEFTGGRPGELVVELRGREPRTFRTTL
jgi:hypothetical protein